MPHRLLCISEGADLEFLRVWGGVLHADARSGDGHLERLPELGALLPLGGHSPSRAAALEPVRAEWELPKNVAVSVAILNPIERSAALLSACLLRIRLDQYWIPLDFLKEAESLF